MPSSASVSGSGTDPRRQPPVQSAIDEQVSNDHAAVWERVKARQPHEICPSGHIETEDQCSIDCGVVRTGGNDGWKGHPDSSLIQLRSIVRDHLKPAEGATARRPVVISEAKQRVVQEQAEQV